MKTMRSASGAGGVIPVAFAERHTAPKRASLSQPMMSDVLRGKPEMNGELPDSFTRPMTPVSGSDILVALKRVVATDIQVNAYRRPPNEWRISCEGARGSRRASSQSV